MERLFFSLNGLGTLVEITDHMCEEPGRLQSMVLPRVRPDLATEHHVYILTLVSGSFAKRPASRLERRAESLASPRDEA